MDARQTIALRGALEYGVGYVLVLPGADGVPVIGRCTRPRVWPGTRTTTTSGRVAP